MLVQSFSKKDSVADYQAFCKLLGCEGERGKVVRVGIVHDVELFLAWVDCNPATDADIARATAG